MMKVETVVLQKVDEFNVYAFVLFYLFDFFLDIAVRVDFQSNQMVAVRRNPTASPTTVPSHTPTVGPTKSGYNYIDTHMDAQTALEKALQLTDVQIAPMESSVPAQGQQKQQ